jgi:serine kinase of HPr protein (carbohydrate metabolism regulator)
VAVVGFKGSGKSSLAAGLYARGHAPVTDDIVVVRLGDRPSLVPSFPRMKLDERALASLGLVDGSQNTDGKRWYAVDDRFERNPVPLDTVFVLEERDVDGPTFDALEPATAMERLLRHSASAELVQATGTERRHFRECARLAEATDVKRLYRPDDLSRLPELVQTVEDALD